MTNIIISSCQFQLINLNVFRGLRVGVRGEHVIGKTFVSSLSVLLPRSDSLRGKECSIINEDSNDIGGMFLSDEVLSPLDILLGPGMLAGAIFKQSLPLKGNDNQDFVNLYKCNGTSPVEHCIFGTI